MPALRPGSFLSRAFGPKEQRSLPPALESLMGFFGVPHTFKPKESLEAYGDNVWLYAAVTKVAFEVARTKFKLRKVSARGDVEYVEKHQALATLRKPQPVGQKSLLTEFDLKLQTAMHMMLAGEGYWAMDGRMGKDFGGGPTSIQVALPHFMFPNTDRETGDLTGYTYRTGHKEKALALEDVVQFRLPDPLNPYRGHAPTQAIRYSLDTNFKADQLNLKRIDNNAVPTGVIKSTDGTTLNEDQMKRLRTSWQQLYGGAGNAGKVAVLPGKLDFQQIQFSPQELQYLEGKNANRDEILAAYGVGLEILGKTESQTRANAEAAIFVFMKFGVLPIVEKFCDTLTNDYLPAFPGTEGLEFCFDDPVPENTEEKRLNVQALWAVGGITPNEARQKFGEEPLATPGMDETYLDFGKAPVGAPPPEPDPMPDPLGLADTNE